MPANDKEFGGRSSPRPGRQMTTIRSLRLQGSEIGDRAVEIHFAGFML